MSAIIAARNICQNRHFQISREIIFTGDQVIDAYATGNSEGLKPCQKDLVFSFDRNIKRCSIYTIDIIRHLTDINFLGSEAFLKIENPNYYRVMITVKEVDFLNPEFLNVYGYVSNLEDKVRKDDFYIEFSFLDYTTGINRTRLIADGYIFKLNDQDKKNTWRA